MSESIANEISEEWKKIIEHKVKLGVEEALQREIAMLWKRIRRWAGFLGVVAIPVAGFILTFAYYQARDMIVSNVKYQVEQSVDKSNEMYKKVYDGIRTNLAESVENSVELEQLINTTKSNLEIYKTEAQNILDETNEMRDTARQRTQDALREIEVLETRSTDLKTSIDNAYALISNKTEVQKLIAIVEALKAPGQEASLANIANKLSIQEEKLNSNSTIIVSLTNRIISTEGKQAVAFTDIRNLKADVNRIRTLRSSLENNAQKQNNEAAAKPSHTKPQEGRPISQRTVTFPFDSGTSVEAHCSPNERYVRGRCSIAEAFEPKLVSESANGKNGHTCRFDRDLNGRTATIEITCLQSRAASRL